MTYGRQFKIMGSLQSRGDITKKENKNFGTHVIEEIEENLLSVIIPVYNAEKRIQSCVKSVLGQTYRNLELLLVDDGSTDSSSKLCDMFSEIDNRVRVFHIANSGPSEARNVGLLHMRGEYLAFVDADDYLELDMYEIMICEIKKERVQMAVCNWKNHIIDSNLCRDSDIGKCGKIEAQQLRRVIASEDIIGGGGYPWNRVIDWKYVLESSGGKHVLFPREVNVYEDKIWMIRILNYMQDVILLPDVKYHYMIEEGSLSHRKASDKLWDWLQAWRLIDQEFVYQLSEDAVSKREKQTLNMLWNVTKEREFFLLRKAWPECADIAKNGVRSAKDRIKYWIMRGLVVGGNN